MNYANRFRQPIGDKDHPFKGWRTDPLNNGVESFGAEYLPGKYHTGDDWNYGSKADDKGAAVYAVARGTVVFADEIKGSTWGKVMIVRHKVAPGTKHNKDDGYVYSYYAHLQNLKYTIPSGAGPKQFKKVKFGEKIAEIGPYDSGTPHLHFEMRWKDSFGPGIHNSLVAADSGAAAREKILKMGWLDPSDFIENFDKYNNDLPILEDFTLKNLKLRDNGTVKISVAKLLAQAKDPNGDRLKLADLDGDGQGKGWVGNGTAKQKGGAIIFTPDKGAKTGKFAFAVNDGRTDDSTWGVVTLKFGKAGPVDSTIPSGKHFADTPDATFKHDLSGTVHGLSYDNVSVTMSQPKEATVSFLNEGGQFSVSFLRNYKHFDLILGEGNDTAKLGLGNDTVRGGDGRDVLFGGGGRDTLYGQAGRDTLKGGTGRDILKGGTKSDTFIFGKGFGQDEILDFQDDVDRLRLDDKLWRGKLTAKQIVEKHAEATKDGTVLTFGKNTIEIDDIRPRDLIDDIQIF